MKRKKGLHQRPDAGLQQKSGGDSTITLAGTKPGDPGRSVITLRVPEPLKRRLEASASEAGVSVNAFISTILWSFLKA
jgi:predicted HicB family RNase H-like nuclease